MTLINVANADDVEAAMLVFAERAGLAVHTDGALTMASDMLANILHWVAVKQDREEALEAVRKGVSHFVSERG